MYSTKTVVVITAVAATFSPFTSLAAHAEGGAALTGGVGASVSAVESGVETATVRTRVKTDEGFDTTLGDKTGLLVITRANAKVFLASNHSSETQATSSESLRVREAALVSEDPRISSMALSSSTVTLSYQEPAKLFWIVGVDIPVKMSVNAAGVSSVNYPWYSFLLSTNKAGLAIRTQTAVQNALSTRVSTAATLSAAEEARLVDALHAVLHSEADVHTSGSAG